MEALKIDSRLSSDIDEEFIRHLKNLSIFKELTLPQLQIITKAVKLKQFEPGAELIIQGFPVTAVFFIKNGLVDVLVNDDRVAQRGELDTIGEMSCLSGERFASATVKAVTRCQAWEIERELFISIINSIPSLRSQMFSLISSRLQQISHRFSEILKHIPHGIIKIDVQGLITDEFSSRCIEYFGVSRLTGKSFGELLFVDDSKLKNRWEETIQSMVENGSDITSKIRTLPSEVTYPHPDGTNRIFELFYHDCRDESGKLVGFDIGMDDVTRSRYYKTQLSSFKDLLTRMEQLLILFDSESGLVIQETISKSKIGQLHFPSWKNLKGSNILSSILSYRSSEERQHLDRWLKMLQDPFVLESMDGNQLADLAPRFAIETATGDVAELTFSLGRNTPKGYREILCSLKFLEAGPDCGPPVYSTMQLMEEITAAEKEHSRNLPEALNEMQTSLDIVQSLMSTPDNLLKNQNRIAAIIHSVKGLGQSFGLSTIATASHEFEDVLGDTLKGNQNPETSEQLIDLFKSLLSLILVSRSLCKTERDLDLGVIRNRKPEIQISQKNYKALHQHFARIVESFQKSPHNQDDLSALMVLKKEIESYGQTKPGDVFPRLQRIVADTSNLLNKKVEFIIHEKSTAMISIEKGHVLNSCLIQLVKNAVCHGVETKEERKFLGKPEKALIELIIARNGTNLVVCVKDDGKGLNFKKIAERALLMKLVDAETCQKLLEEKNHEHIANWIWETGFSTSESISLASGRGVGMSMVKEEIERLGGTVRIEATEGKCSRITLHIPINDD